MPPQDCIWRHERGDLAEEAASKRFAANSEASALVIGEPHVPPIELRPQDPILFFQVLNDVLLLAIDPACKE